MEDKLDESAKRRLEHYRKFVGKFVTVTKKDGYIVAGVLEDITPDNHLYVKGTHKESIFHFLQVKEFTGRPDKYYNKGGQNS